MSKALRTSLMLDATKQPLISEDLDRIPADNLGWELTEPKPGKRFLAPRLLPPKVFKW